MIIGMKACARCGKELDSRMEIFRSSSCPDCRADLRTCTNCAYYQKGAHWDCRETISEPVADKERGNFCDFFRFRDLAPRRSGPAQPRKNAKADFNKLFGD
jgi:hypothetical protein